MCGIFTGPSYTISLVHQSLLTDFIMKTNAWRWTNKEEPCFQELKKKSPPRTAWGYPTLRAE